MAEISFELPDLGEGLVEARVLDWLVSLGDLVSRGDPLVEVETTKSTVELPSPQTGVVVAFHAEEDDLLHVGDTLVTFEVDDEQAGIVGTVPQAATPERRVRLQPPED